MKALAYVNPNRMELLRLKKRLVLARRGHKLLKDKQEQLVRTFLALVTEVKALRREVDQNLAKAYKSFVSAAMSMDEKALLSAIMFGSKKPIMEISKTPIMNLRIPSFKISWEGGGQNYGFADTVCDLDISLKSFEEIIPRLMELLQKENALYMVSAELSSTRRRVSALEHVFMPKLEQTIKSINSKLGELERAASVRLMKVKEIVRSH